MLLHLHVKPNSKIDQIFYDRAGNLKVKIRAQPIDGQANEYLIEYLAGIFKLSKSKVQLVKGLNNQHKTIKLTGDEEVFKGILNSFLVVN